MHGDGIGDRVDKVIKKLLITSSWCTTGELFRSTQLSKSGACWEDLFIYFINFVCIKNKKDKKNQFTWNEQAA